MAQAKRSSERMPVETSLAAENDGTWKHEFVGGLAFAMAGASDRHNGVRLNMAGSLNATVDEPCRVHDGDMKLRVQIGQDIRFYYPDVLVSCATDNQDDDVRGDAGLVIEVLSPSTERTDRYEKFAAYTSLPMLSEYVLVEQDIPSVELYRRRTGLQLEQYGPGATVTFESIGQSLKVEQIYRRIKF